MKLTSDLTEAEEKFKTFEKIVTQYNDEFSEYLKKSEVIERQNDLIETRHSNQNKLIESIFFLNKIQHFCLFF